MCLISTQIRYYPHLPAFLGECGEYDHCTHLVYYGIRIWYFSPSNASLWFLLLKQYRKGPKTKWLWLMGFESKTADPADLGCTFISPPIQDMSMSSWNLSRKTAD